MGSPALSDPLTFQATTLALVWCLAVLTIIGHSVVNAATGQTWVPRSILHKVLFWLALSWRLLASTIPDRRCPYARAIQHIHP